MTIEDFAETVRHSIPEEVYNDLLQVLREADADLSGMQERWHRRLDVAVDRNAAFETREHIAQVYIALTGHDLEDLEGDSSGPTR